MTKRKDDITYESKVGWCRFFRAAMVDDLMSEVERIDRRPEKMTSFIKNRLIVESSHVVTKYDEYLEKDWIKIQVKDRG